MAFCVPFNPKDSASSNITYTTARMLPYVFHLVPQPGWSSCGASHLEFAHGLISCLWCRQGPLVLMPPSSPLTSSAGWVALRFKFRTFETWIIKRTTLNIALTVMVIGQTITSQSASKYSSILYNRVRLRNYFTLRLYIWDPNCKTLAGTGKPSFFLHSLQNGMSRLCFPWVLWKRISVLTVWPDMFTLAFSGLSNIHWRYTQQFSPSIKLQKNRPTIRSCSPDEYMITTRKRTGLRTEPWGHCIWPHPLTSEKLNLACTISLVE